MGAGGGGAGGGGTGSQQASKREVLEKQMVEEGICGSSKGESVALSFENPLTAPRK
jgi:hypothetical protein